MNGKQLAAEKAVEFIEDGMIVGLGTGSTVEYFLRKLAINVKNGLRMKGVATSLLTKNLALQLGIPLLELDKTDQLDITIDGADEVDLNLNGIKGGGGALLYEKIIAKNSVKNIWIVDSSKLVNKLGKFPLPVEVIKFGSIQLIKNFRESGYNPALRKKINKPFMTDDNNYIIDLNFSLISDPNKLETELKKFTGVIETGLFIDIADIVIVGRENEIEIIERKNKKGKINQN